RTTSGSTAATSIPASAITTATPSSAAAERGLGLRIERCMKIGEKSPIFFRTMVGEGSAERVAVVARRANRLVRDHLILDAMFCHVHDRFRFLRREAMLRRQILEDRLVLSRSEDQTIGANHAFDRLLPALRGGANPRDAREVALLILRVTGSALG